MAADVNITGLLTRFIRFSLSASALLALGLTHPALASDPSAPSPTPEMETSYLNGRLPGLPTLDDAAVYLPDVVKHPTHLVLRIGERRVFVHSEDEVLASYPVAVGRADTPTPTGEFQIFQMIEDPIWQNPWTGEITQPGANSALGLRWIGFAEMSNGIIGFHGTPTVSSIGQAASNGCVRLRNEDVLALFAQVQMGMRVVVEP